LINSTLQVIKNKIFSPEESMRSVPLYSAPIFYETIEEVLDYYNIAKEDQEDEY